MEEENQRLQVTSDEAVKTRVGFPEAASKPKKSVWKLILLIIVVLLLLAAGAWFMFGRNSTTPIPVEISPTAFVSEEIPTTIPTQIISQTDKSELKVQVLNGTGIAGGAGNLKTKLESIGFSDIEVGNASPQNYTDTEVTFASGVGDDVVDEVTELLEETYKSVEVKTGSITGFDIKIITGYPAGYVPSPTARPVSPTATPKLSVTPSTTPSVSVTLTPTPTP